MYIKVTDEWVNIIEDPEEIEDYGTENVFEVAQDGIVLPELKEQLVAHGFSIINDEMFYELGNNSVAITFNGNRISSIVLTIDDDKYEWRF